MANEYATLAELKARLQITDSSSDDELSAVLEGCSRAIDDYCGRRIYAAPETRVFTAEDPDCVFVGDLLSVTSLRTDEDGDRTYERTWAATDYDLGPDNAALDGRPYAWIETAPNGLYTFPTQRRGVQITGSFGYASSTPVQIREACLILAARIHKRGEAVFGVLGMPAVGTAVWIARTDPDVSSLLERFVKRAIGGRYGNG